MPNDMTRSLDPSELAGLTNAAPPPIGHNVANAPLAELLVQETVDLERRRDELLAGVARVPAEIGDEETNQKAADMVRLIAACRKTADANRANRKEPFLAAEKLIQAHYVTRLLDPLDKAKIGVERKMTHYQRARAEEERRIREAEARRQAEEAARLARAAAEREAAAATEQDIDDAISTEALARQAGADAIQAQKAAEAKPAELARTRGDYGAVASLHRFWDFADLDRDTVDLEALRQHLPLDAIEKAVRAFVKAGGRKLQGVHIFENTGTRVR